MLKEVNVENIQVEDTSILIEVNVERYEIVAVNICYFTACFSMGRGRIIVGLVLQNLFEETLGVIGKI